MKHWIISLLAGIAMLVSQPVIAGRCTGKANCMACSNCSSCRYCNEGGGTCGKCGRGDIFKGAASFLSSKWIWVIGCGLLGIAVFSNRKRDR